MTPTPCRVAMHLLGLRRLRIHAMVHLLTYLLILTQLVREYKTGNISETVEDRAKVILI